MSWRTDDYECERCGNWKANFVFAENEEGMARVRCANCLSESIVKVETTKPDTKKIKAAYADDRAVALPKAKRIHEWVMKKDHRST